MQIEECARCKKALGWQQLFCNETLNEWLCRDCDDLLPIFFDRFKKEFCEGCSDEKEK